jgi:hypothetical protein
VKEEPGVEARLPRFELTTFKEPVVGRPDVVEALTKTGVPKGSVGRAYRAASELTWINVPGRGRLICFGKSGLSNDICVDPSNGEVLHVVDGTNPRLVNSTIGQFVESVRAVIGMFPYYETSDDSFDHGQAVADRIAAAIKRIDPAAAEPDTFWETFVQDVAIGDYSTADVVKDRSR